MTTGVISHKIHQEVKSMSLMSSSTGSTTCTFFTCTSTFAGQPEVVYSDEPDVVYSDEPEVVYSDEPEVELDSDDLSDWKPPTYASFQASGSLQVPFDWPPVIASYSGAGEQVTHMDPSRIINSSPLPKDTAGFSKLTFISGTLGAILTSVA